MAESDEKRIDDIVTMLDAFMSGGGGHMNIHYSPGEQVTVTTANSRDCAGANSACCVPTLFEGMDRDDEETGTGK